MSKHIEESDRPFVVCPRCGGNGRHGNEAFDGMSWSVDTFDGSYEDMEEFGRHYFNGDYDVTCSECKGIRVVKTECECQACENERVEEAEYEAERRAEMRMGC